MTPAAAVIKPLTETQQLLGVYDTKPKIKQTKILKYADVGASAERPNVPDP